MAPPAARRHESPAVVALAGLAALAVAMGIGRFAFTPILPMMQADGVLTIAAGGWLAAANYLGYLLGALTAVAIRIRPAPAIRAGLVVIVATTAGMGIEHRFAAWATLRAVAGFRQLVMALGICLVTTMTGMHEARAVAADTSRHRF